MDRRTGYSFSCGIDQLAPFTLETISMAPGDEWTPYSRLLRHLHCAINAVPTHGLALSKRYLQNTPNYDDRRSGTV